ncbi:MBL fold metallo-hydrolase [Mesobacillus stamsii]|uniref:Phosphoribosyl 1,2-cyclic phosphate phosphodiesterase n=1 Tax=Mesobacillus stamsii TaxID=225347 RepID=A0ABU0FVU6_9BACI|nr:MBL fold metallo-hydrolase [Mesobacillus stamsii]MDQ0414043.1 phosphoribosyl 1,2-cyclic phosphate phosphodiesterase [Mesobacillus stamsii]
MKIHFLGTAAAEGFPNAFCRCETCLKARELGEKNIRTRSSTIIDDVIKFDYSPDSYMQALRDNIDFGMIEHLLVTHSHSDHYNAFDLECRRMGIAHGLQHPMHIYGNDAVMHHTRVAIGRFAGKRFAFHLLRPFETIAVGEILVTPLLADHDQMETCLLYVIEKDGKKLLYGHDSGWFPEATWEWLKEKNLDCAILDCTLGRTGNSRDRNHMGVETVLEVQRQFQKKNIVKKEAQIIVTHFSHNSGLLHEELEKIFESSGIVVAHDGLIFHI